jgi:hypothetical protein
MKTMRTTVLAVTLGVLALSGTACQGGEAASATNAPAATHDVSAATLAPGEAIANPGRDAILSIGGLIGETNKRDRLEVDVPTLDRLHVVGATVYEPFLKRDVEFSGVLLSDLFETIGAEPDVADLRMHALDDYEVSLDLDRVDLEDMLLATRANGSPIAIADGGPVRLVFLNRDGLGLNTDNWIWSIDAMELAR